MLVSVEEYLSTSYDPDVEYADGVLVERNIGDWEHSLVQSNVIVAIARKYSGVWGVPAVRSRVASTRYRLPDVSVLLKIPGTEILLDAGFLVIEILSENDRFTWFWERLKEFAANGTPHLWVFDPRLKQLFTFRSNSLREVEGDVIATDNPRLELTREEIFLNVDAGGLPDVI